MSEQILLKREGGLLTICLNRRERRNAMTPDMTQALTQTLAEAAEDDEIRAVILTGAGGHFCVGGDVKAMNKGTGAGLAAGRRIHNLRERMNAASYLHLMPKPTIAAIEGSAAGAGLSLALACDLRICAEDAKLTTAFAKVALSGDFGGSYFLTQMVGAAKARELYLLSAILSGKEAFDLGIVTRSVPADQVQSAANELGKSLANGPTPTYGRMKSNLALAASGAGLAACLDQEARNHTLSMLTADHREAAQAFVEKRPASFQGK